MVKTPQDDQSQGQEDKGAFLAQIGQRIGAIEENWGNLRSGPWNQELLQTLYSRIRDLAETADQCDLFQLGENVFSAEVYLSSFVDAEKPPSPHQIEEIDGLIRTLRAAAEVTSQTEGDSQETGVRKGTLVYLFGAVADVTSPLVEALRNRDCEVEAFDSASGLLKAMDLRPPNALLIDTAQLAHIAPISAERVRLKTQHALDLPMIFVSSSKNLQLRVDAMRAGGDVYFVAPIDAPRVADQILDLAVPSEPEERRVLVVEDDPTQADFIASILRKAGMTVQIATEPLRVMHLLEDFRPDLILMDIYMPEINGIELTSIIRDHNQFVATPLVFLSGEQDAEKQLDALSVGGDDFLAKPIRPQHLLTVVRNRIDRARSVQRAAGVRPEYDRATGLFNRKHFLQRVAKVLESHPADTTASVVYLRPDDLDNLTKNYGIGKIDALIAELGHRIHEHLESQDVVCRFEDTAIALLLRRESTDAVGATAENLRRKLADQMFELNDAQQNLTTSIGICVLNQEQEEPATMVARAARACQIATDAGGNRVETYHAEPGEATAPPKLKDAVTDALRTAHNEQTLVVHYQPLLDLQARGSESYELLMRLQMPNGDLLTDAELDEPAARANLATDLDQWLVERAVQLLKDRRDVSREIRLFVRQLSRTASDPNFPAWLAGRLRARQTVGTGLVLDYRLTDVSQDLKAVQANFAALREMDVETCLSLFPEKPAAFKVLRFLGSKYLEVAPRLLKADQQTIKYMIDQAHELQAKVIVSNIDDPRSVDLHWSSGADFLQGNFIQRPLEQMDYDFYQVVV